MPAEEVVYILYTSLLGTLYSTPNLPVKKLRLECGSVTTTRRTVHVSRLNHTQPSDCVALFSIVVRPDCILLLPFGNGCGKGSRVGG